MPAQVQHLRERQTRAWTAGALAFARAMRLADPGATKTAVAQAIARRVDAAPRNVAYIALWLRDCEQSGDLPLRIAPAVRSASDHVAGAMQRSDRFGAEAGRASLEVVS